MRKHEEGMLAPALSKAVDFGDFPAEFILGARSTLFAARFRAVQEGTDDLVLERSKGYG